MINREETLEFAREFQIEPNVVEKDYALCWLLVDVGNHPVLRDSWVFKGALLADVNRSLRSKMEALKKPLRLNRLSFHACIGTDSSGSPGEPKGR